MIGINIPIRIGKATVMPADVVLGRDGGVLFIPPQPAEKVAKTSEMVRLRDLFGHQRLREGRYTAGQIDTRWSPEIERDLPVVESEHRQAAGAPRADPGTAEGTDLIGPSAPRYSILACRRPSFAAACVSANDRQ